MIQRDAGSLTIGELAAQRRAALFVDRDDELAIMDEALAAEQWPHQVLFVSGPAGIGKSALLARFGERAEAAGVPTARIEYARAKATPEAVCDALTEQLGPNLPERLAAGRHVRFWTIIIWPPRWTAGLPIAGSPSSPPRCCW